MRNARAVRALLLSALSVAVAGLLLAGEARADGGDEMCIFAGDYYPAEFAEGITCLF